MLELKNFCMYRVGTRRLSHQQMYSVFLRSAVFISNKCIKTEVNVALVTHGAQNFKLSRLQAHCKVPFLTHDSKFICQHRFTSINVM
jgi:hypothetical protein